MIGVMSSPSGLTVFRRAHFICQSCRKSVLYSQRSLSYTTSTKCLIGKRQKLDQDATLVPSLLAVRHSSSSTLRNPLTSRGATNAKEHPASSKAEPKNLADELKSLNTQVSAITSAKSAADEEEVQALLEQGEKLATVLVLGGSRSAQETEVHETYNTASSTLADLEEASPTRRVSRVSGALSIPFRAKAAESLCEVLYDFVRDPKVFISPSVLDIYARIQCSLGKPEYLPEIFYLYANKPVAQPKTSPIKYRNQSPNSAKNAIPMHLSDMALEAAIAKKDLPLAITIIDQTVATPAFRRNKLLRKATLPVVAVAATPVCAYAGAHWVSQWQNVWDSEMATTTAMAGALAYIGTLTIIGFVAVTTYNDHHDRVVWLPGAPLRQRWTREEERLYFDRLASAWGFQQKFKRGEEQGEEWEALREVIGMREMVLDKTELMEGME